jgi:adenylate cyclase
LASDKDRRLAAILNADAVGYTRLMADDELATIETVTAYKREMTELIDQHRGRTVDSPGDNLLAEFSSATQAVMCAVKIQEVLAEQNAALPPHRRMDFRAAVHLGEVVVEAGRIYGDGVNVAARLEALADPGTVCVSEKVFEEVEGKLALDFDDLGEQWVKNFPRPVRAYQVRVAGARERPPVGSRAGARWQWVAGGALALIGTIGLAVWLASSGPDSTPVVTGLGEIRSLAVLPLENLSGEAAQEFFTDGMTEALISHLAQIASLSVVSRTSVMQYAGIRMPLPEIARKLGVDAVVEGSVLRAGDDVRITVQLIDARSDRHLWSESYQRDLRDVLTLQSEVARAIAAQIKLTLDPAEAARLADQQTVHPAAYEAFLRGSYLLKRQGATNHAKSVELLEQAVALDPDYAPAWARLADGYT